MSYVPAKTVDRKRAGHAAVAARKQSDRAAPARLDVQDLGERLQTALRRVARVDEHVLGPGSDRRRLLPRKCRRRG